MRSGGMSRGQIHSPLRLRRSQDLGTSTSRRTVPPTRPPWRRTTWRTAHEPRAGEQTQTTGSWPWLFEHNRPLRRMLLRLRAEVTWRSNGGRLLRAGTAGGRRIPRPVGPCYSLPAARRKVGNLKRRLRLDGQRFAGLEDLHGWTDQALTRWAQQRVCPATGDSVEASWQQEWPRLRLAHAVEALAEELSVTRRGRRQACLPAGRSRPSSPRASRLIPCGAPEL
jgi:hypothetical protein